MADSLDLKFKICVLSLLVLLIRKWFKWEWLDARERERVERAEALLIELGQEYDRTK